MQSGGAAARVVQQAEAAVQVAPGGGGGQWVPSSRVGANYFRRRLPERDARWGPGVVGRSHTAWEAVSFGLAPPSVHRMGRVIVLNTFVILTRRERLKGQDALQQPPTAKGVAKPGACQLNTKERVLSETDGAPRYSGPCGWQRPMPAQRQAGCLLAQQQDSWLAQNGRSQPPAVPATPDGLKSVCLYSLDARINMVCWHQVQ